MGEKTSESGDDGGVTGEIGRTAGPATDLDPECDHDSDDEREPRSRSDTIDEFCTTSRAVGVDVTRVSRSEVTSTLADLCETPVVATSLPWPDVALPDDVTTRPTPAQLEAATTGITAAHGGIAEYGSLLLRSTGDGVEPVSLYPDRHVAVLAAADVVSDVSTAFAARGEAFREKAASLIVATGPSATADMGELVTGAHGPSEVHVILFDDGDRTT